MKKLLGHLTKLACEFENITETELYARIIRSNKKLINEWENRETITQFYKDSKNYLYDLIFFNDDERLGPLFYPISGFKNQKILDFGAGIGELSMILSYNKNDVYYYDISEHLKKFAKFVSEKTKRPLTFLETKNEIFKRTYDTILILDILEHLENPIETVKSLSNLLPKNGIIYTTGLTFAINENVPFHLPENREKEKELLDFLQENFQIIFFHITKNETLSLWVKK